MVVGHYATALVAKERDPKTPLWLFLAAAMLLDFAMSAFVLAGIEKLERDPVKTSGSIFERALVDMTFSHDVVPVAIWTLLAATFAYAVTSRLVAALWVAALVIVHELSDFAAGFGHFVLGPDSQPVGLALYSTAPLPAIGIELVFALACVYWFTSRTNLPRWKTIGLYLTVLLGIGAMIPNAI
jgi:hypothetical protein